MKKIIINTSLLILSSLTLQAQLKVHTGGSLSFGSSAVPLLGAKFQFAGNTLFTATTSTTTSSAYIVGKNTWSTAASPDYTWYGNTNTGIFHSTLNIFLLVQQG